MQFMLTEMKWETKNKTTDVEEPHVGRWCDQWLWNECLYCTKTNPHPLWNAQRNLSICFYLIYILTEKVPLRKPLGTETLSQFQRKLNFRGTNVTQMQLVHNNLFHFLYYNSIIYFFDSKNMTATRQNNHPTPNLNLLMKYNPGQTGI